MMNSGNLTLEALIALAGIFLGLAIAVQVLQEIYKYVTSNKARAYRIALRDFLGDWVDRAYGCEALAGMYVRGPFESLKGLVTKPFRRQKSPPSVLLPLKKDDLLHAVDRAAPEWIRRVVDVLKKERDLQGGEPASPSPVLRELIDDSRARCARDSPARKTLDFLKKWQATGEPGEDGTETPLDAARVLEAFYQRYVPERAKVTDEFEQFTANFEHAYQRRNFRQTLILAFLFTLVLGLPVTALYSEARNLAPEQQIQLTQSLNELYQKAEKNGRTEEAAKIEKLFEQLNEPLDLLFETHELDLGAGVERLKESSDSAGGFFGYLLKCLLTALMIAFGAPFWDRLSKALLSVRKPGGAAESAPKETTP